MYLHDPARVPWVCTYLYDTDPAQHIITVNKDLGGLDRDLLGRETMLFCDSRGARSETCTTTAVVRWPSYATAVGLGALIYTRCEPTFGWVGSAHTKCGCVRVGSPRMYVVILGLAPPSAMALIGLPAFIRSMWLCYS